MQRGPRVASHNSAYSTAYGKLLTLQSDNLLRVLTLTRHQVKIMRGERVIDRVSNAEAIRLAMLRQYEGVGTPTRVKQMWLTSVEMRREHPWQPGWRTTSGPALQPSVEWVTSRLTAY